MDSVIIEKLRSFYNQGARIVQVHFSGSGDSGDIWSIEYLGASEATPRPHIKVEGDDSDWRDALYRYINEAVTIDWYNNDGGGGCITFDMEAKIAEVTSYWNETVAHEQDPHNDTLPAFAPEHPIKAVRAAKKLPKRRAK